LSQTVEEEPVDLLSQAEQATRQWANERQQ
jgi:hypothetical protein